jgi:hypothetical protein
MWLFQRLVYLIIITLAVIIGAAARRYLSRPFRAVLLLLIITLLVESAGVWLAYHGANSFLYHLFNPIECLCWCYVYYQLFAVQSQKRLIITAGLTVIVFMLVNSLWIQPFLQSVNYYSIVAESSFLLLGSLLYFKELLRKPGEEDILKLSFFWLNCAVLFFYTINILFWSSYGFLRDHNKAMLHAGFKMVIYTNYIFYGVIGYSLLLERTHHKKINTR